MHVADTLQTINHIYNHGVDIIAVDTETFYDSSLGGVLRFINGKPHNRPFGVAVYYELNGKPFRYWFTKELHLLQGLFSLNNLVKVFHNTKYDLHMLQNIGVTVPPPIWDTMCMAHNLNEEMECVVPNKDGVLYKRKSKKLKDLAYHFLGESSVEEQVVFKRCLRATQAKRGSEASYKDVWELFPDETGKYAIKDAEITYRLAKKFTPLLQEQGLWRAMQLDMDATMVLFDMERKGIQIHNTKVRQDSKRLTQILEDIEKDMVGIVGLSFNPDSAAEVVSAFKLLGVTWQWYTSKGNADTQEKTIVHLRDTGAPLVSKLAQCLLEHSEASKLLSTYIRGVDKYIQQGRVHCDYGVYPDEDDNGGTKTGRTSCSKPNLQNIPKDPAVVRGYTVEPRKYFIPDEGYVFVEFDAQQEEYRLLAHYGDDTHFKDMIIRGWDIHTSTASQIYGVPYDAVTSDLRAKGKRTNFALVYGLGNASFAETLGYKIDTATIKKAMAQLSMHYKPYELPPYKTLYNCTVNTPEVKYFLSQYVQNALKDAIKTKEKYFNMFPGIKAFLKTATRLAETRGYVKTWTGRRRRFPSASDAYKAPNAIIQGGCGDILKDRLTVLHQFLRGKKTFLCLQVHDSILLQVHETEEYLIPQINRVLNDTDFRVPITWEYVIYRQAWGESG